MCSAGRGGRRRRRRAGLGSHSRCGATTSAPAVASSRAAAHGSHRRALRMAPTRNEIRGRIVASPGPRLHATCITVQTQREASMARDASCSAQPRRASVPPLETEKTSLGEGAGQHDRREAESRVGGPPWLDSPPSGPPGGAIDLGGEPRRSPATGAVGARSQYTSSGLRRRTSPPRVRIMCAGTPSPSLSIQPWTVNPDPSRVRRTS